MKVYQIVDDAYVRSAKPTRGRHYDFEAALNELGALGYGVAAVLERSDHANGRGPTLLLERTVLCEGFCGIEEDHLCEEVLCGPHDTGPPATYIAASSPGSEGDVEFMGNSFAACRDCAKLAADKGHRIRKLSTTGF